MSQIDERQMLPKGTVLDHRYRIIRYLASGGFGNTYVAEDSHLKNKKLAVKEFFMRGTNHRSADGTTVEVSNDTNTPVFNTQLEKFQREALRIFELRNNHIIHVSDLFNANGTSYYVMDLINGTSLADQTLSESEAHDVILQVLDALETMHAEGLYHLDVKPGNIMRDANGHCTLIDFGASKQLSADEQNTLSSSTMAYTQGYAPLEQTSQRSKEIGPWTDFYALGATLYRLVTGTTPPEVSVTDSAPDGRQFPYPETVSATMRHSISTLMNPIYTLRPQTAAEVRALLEGTYQHEEPPKPKKEPKTDEKPKPEETVLDNPSPDTTDDKTQRISSPTPIPPPSPQNISEKTNLSPNTPQNNKPSKKGLWYVLAGIAALLIGLIILPKGCGENKIEEPYNPTIVIPNDSLTNKNDTISNSKSVTPTDSILDEKKNTKQDSSKKEDVEDTYKKEIIDETSKKEDVKESSKKDPIETLPSLPTSFKTCPDGKHPHKIDLGLPSGTLWACCNVGANKPEGYGGYYAWGETKEKSVYNYDTYEHGGEGEDFHNLGNNICGTKYDVAHMKWGGAWKMPSDRQIQELLNNCSTLWTIINGINGCELTSKKNGGSIFIPAAGARFSVRNEPSGSVGVCWSGIRGIDLNVSRNNVGKGEYLNEVIGMSVRPVCK